VGFVLLCALSRYQFCAPVCPVKVPVLCCCVPCQGTSFVLLCALSRYQFCAAVCPVKVPVLCCCVPCQGTSSQNLVLFYNLHHTVCEPYLCYVTAGVAAVVLQVLAVTQTHSLAFQVMPKISMGMASILSTSSSVTSCRLCSFSLQNQTYCLKPFHLFITRFTVCSGCKGLFPF